MKKEKDAKILNKNEENSKPKENKKDMKKDSTKQKVDKSKNEGKDLK